MSISINPYANNGYYVNQPQTKTVSSKENTYTQGFADILELSGSNQMYAGDAFGISYDSSETLSTSDKKNYLANLQSYLNSASFSSNASDPFNQALSTIKDSLTSFDLTTAADDQVTELFNQTMQTLESIKPKHHRNELASLVKMALDMSDGSNQGDSVSVDDMKNFLSTLVDQISSSTVNSSDSTSNTSDLLISFQNILSGTDLSKASDTEIRDMFNKILDAIKSAASQEQDEDVNDNNNESGTLSSGKTFIRPFFPLFNLTLPSTTSTQTSDTSGSQVEEI